MHLYERIFDLAFSRLFFYPSHEIYPVKAGFYDYGPVGVLMKKAIEELWRKEFIHLEGYLEVESAIITPEEVLIASGHVKEFTDPVVMCEKCKRKFRADKLLEEKGINPPSSLESIEEALRSYGIVCPSCGGPLGKVEKVNLMFSVNIGYDGERGYLRPETAQGIFVSFPRIFVNAGVSLPFAVGQVGKSFRNEISPRKGLIRCREFTQMELEYFFNPKKPNHEKFSSVKGEKIMIKLRGSREPQEKTLEELKQLGVGNEILLYFLWKEWQFFKTLGIPEDKMWFRHLDEEETPHYSKSNVDLEVELSYGVVEVAGNAYRTDYDLSSHQSHSKKKMSVSEDGERFIPHVVEISIGVDRTFYSALEYAYREKGEKDWEWFAIPPVIAPYQVAVFPLVKKSEELRKVALDVWRELAKRFRAFYSDKGTIGKRYARADEIGVPYAVTVDFQTLEDGSVTIRYRDDGRQERVKISDLSDVLERNISEGKTSLR